MNNPSITRSWCVRTSPANSKKVERESLTSVSEWPLSSTLHKAKNKKGWLLLVKVCEPENGVKTFFLFSWCLSYFIDHISCKCISVRFSSVAQSCLTPCDPMNCSTPGLPVHHQLQESTQTHVHGVGDAIQPSHPMPFPSPPAFNLPQHQGLFKWVSSSHQVAKVLEF